MREQRGTHVSSLNGILLRQVRYVSLAQILPTTLIYLEYPHTKLRRPLDLEARNSLILPLLS